MPKLNLYRNISITFVIFVAILLVAIFLFLSSKATVIITPNPQKVSLSFNLEVKENPTADELSEKDVVAGKIETYVKAGSLTSEVLSTQAVASEIVGQVKLINDSRQDQALVKTTQLQADNGVIVRTAENVIVKAGSSINVSVVAKDPAEFKDIDPGDLVIIKLNPALQDKIYGVVEKTLNNDPHDIKVLADSDIARAKEKLSQRLTEEVKKENNLSGSIGLLTEIKSFKSKNKIGDEVDNFDLEMELEVKYLKLTSDEQLANLIIKKVNNLNLSGLSVGDVNVSDVESTIVDDDLNGSVLVKVNYFVLVKIDENNALLTKKHLSGQKIDSIKELLMSSQDVISDVEILASPYWTKSFPKQESKINVIIK